MYFMVVYLQNISSMNVKGGLNVLKSQARYSKSE